MNGLSQPGLKKKKRKDNGDQIKLTTVVHVVFNIYLFTYLILLHAIIRTAIAEICFTF